MPLLKKKLFEKRGLPDILRDDEEVFYCAITNEIFRDYDEFSERMLLCNSMVWTCSMTGKSNLTYAEALESEENAKKSLKEFPLELRIPILFLSSKTRRTAFGDMADDVFIYVKDRFFVGENLEASFTGNKWKDSHVLQVIAPTEEQIKNFSENGINNEHNFGPQASLFKYEIEHLDADDKDISEIMIVDSSQIRRKKALFSREKCKLFLKQYVEQDESGVFAIKQSVLEKFGIHKMKFEQIFAGPLPNFESSKRIKNKSPQNNNKKFSSKQESMSKYLTKNGTTNGVKEASSTNLLEQMKKREEEFKLMKQLKEEQRLALKQERRREDRKIANWLREWKKPKEDLELEDQTQLPVPVPVKSKVSDEFVGDMFMILEFVDSFADLLSKKNFFPNGFTLEIIERALTEKEVAGPLIDIIQMLLVAIFNCQDEESLQYRIDIKNIGDIKVANTKNLTLQAATRLATSASKWSDEYQGLPLSRLPLYSLTASEVLRLHLLSSGAKINETGAKWRYAQRGGYTSEDDPGLYFRLHETHILKALATKNVVELSISDKIKIISCLIDQLLTYADVRDIVEERLEKVRQYKNDVKQNQIIERKCEQEFIQAKFKVKKDSELDVVAKKVALETIEKDYQAKVSENDANMKKMAEGLCKFQSVLGHDRAFRKYLKLESVPGIFINSTENAGVCLDSIVKQNPDLVNSNRSDIIKYVRKLYEEVNSSDKENEPSTKESVIKKINGVHSPLLDGPDLEKCRELLMCSADSKTCAVHSNEEERIAWTFIRDESQLEEFINSLNKRGVRESELFQTLKMCQPFLIKLIQKSPFYPNVDDNKSICEKEQTNEQPKDLYNKSGKKTTKERYDANLGYSTDMDPNEVLHKALIENILELEEKIHAGNLGCLRVKDRNEWRNCLLNQDYNNIDKSIIKLENKTSLIKTEINNKDVRSRSNTPELSEEKIEYQDPGYFLGPINESSNEVRNSNDINCDNTDDRQDAVHSLAIALLQVAISVEPENLKKPLGKADVGKHSKKAAYDILDKWEESLLASTSFSQICLHYGTLDWCIRWTRSILLARCRVCRRQKDAENMLLCDGCKLGQHLYCLKPKLTAVPKGDWFCNKCQKEKEIQEVILSSKPVPKKKRRIFRVEEDESDVNEDSDYEENINEVDEKADDDLLDIKSDLCKMCGSGGEVIGCEKCSDHYHIECVEPPLRRIPRGWVCNTCKESKEKRRRNYGMVVQCATGVNNQRRCAAKARYKIHNFVKSLRQLSESDDILDDSDDEIIHSRRNNRREDLPLHNATLQELLTDVMKHVDAWAFLRPVQKNEVPDYYDVITKPMDFGTIKYKLNMGEYKEDEELMRDVILVFENCNTYNHIEAEVYKCGVRLLKHFQRKCKELGLRVPPELLVDDGSEGDEEEFKIPIAKRRRTK